MPSGSSIHISIRAQGLCRWFLYDRDSGVGQPGVFGVNIPYPNPGHHRMPG
jgi:hypothetical protein